MLIYVVNTLKTWKPGKKFMGRTIAIYAHLHGKYSENLISPGINLCSDELQFMLINVEL